MSGGVRKSPPKRASTRRSGGKPPGQGPGKVSDQPVRHPVIPEVTGPRATAAAIVTDGFEPKAQAPRADDAQRPRDWSVRSGQAGRKRRLGLGLPVEGELGTFSPTRLLQVLGPERVQPLSAVHVPARVLYVNFELARELGFEVPEPPRLTPELEAALVEHLSWKALPEGEPAGDRRTLTVYADRYEGTHQGVHRGAGRAAFLPFGNLNLKGIGETPLNSAVAKFDHRHGGAALKEAMLEAIWGEVNTQLFTRGGSRILAVLDTGDFTEWEDGGREKRALIVRMGTQLRPGHLLADEGHGAHNVFLRAAKETGDLVLRQGPNGLAPDYRETMLRLVDHHARTSAEQFRWRVLHGGMSTSNIELDGAQIDAGTMTALSETAPAYVLEHMDKPTGTFGQEHLGRAEELQLAYEEVLRSLVLSRLPTDKSMRIDFPKEMRAAYERHFTRQMLQATGLRAEVAERLARAEPELVARYARLLQALASVYDLEQNRDVDKTLMEGVSTFDVFSVLQALPAARFGGHPDTPLADEVRALWRYHPPSEESASRMGGRLQVLLSQVGLGLPPARGKGGPVPGALEALNEAVTPLAERLDALHREVLSHAEKLGLEQGLYESPEAFRASVMTRARFENQPLDPLYRAALDARLVKTVDAYLHTDDPHVVADAIERSVAASARSVDALLRQGEARRLSDDTLELGIRTLEGIRYSLVADAGGDRSLRVGLAVEGDDVQGYRLTSFDSDARFSREQLETMVYHFTTSDWGRQGGPPFLEKRAELDVEDGRLVGVRFELPMLSRSEVGWLEGMFFLEANGRVEFKDGASNFVAYPFAIPDGAELATLARELDSA